MQLPLLLVFLLLLYGYLLYRAASSGTMQVAMIVLNEHQHIEEVVGLLGQSIFQVVNAGCYL